MNDLLQAIYTVAHTTNNILIEPLGELAFRVSVPGEIGWLMVKNESKWFIHPLAENGYVFETATSPPTSELFFFANHYFEKAMEND